MSSYLHGFKAEAIVKCLDAFEKMFAFAGGLDSGEFDDWTLRRLMEDFRETQSNGHLDTDLNTAWFAFQADYQKEPGSALDSARRLRSLLLDKFAPNQRLKFYRDSNTIVLDRQSHTGFAPEQFEILEYLWEQGPGKWTPVREMIEKIEILKGVSDRTVRRYINDPELCHEIRDLIEEQPGKGHRLVLPRV